MIPSLFSRPARFTADRLYLKYAGIYITLVNNTKEEEHERFCR